MVSLSVGPWVSTVGLSIHLAQYALIHPPRFRCRSRGRGRARGGPRRGIYRSTRRLWRDCGDPIWVPSKPLPILCRSSNAMSCAQTVAQVYGYGSPLHLAAMALLPQNGDGLGGVPLTVYPLEDDPSGVAASGVITPAGTVTTPAAYQVRIGGILSNQFVVADGDGTADICASMAAAINAVLAMPCSPSSLALGQLSHRRCPG